jgi:hypothetical protein
MVPQEYHQYLDAFEKDEKTKLPPHRPGVDLEIQLEEGQKLPTKKIYALSEDELEELRQYIKQNEKRGWIEKPTRKEDHQSCLSKRKMANSDFAWTIEHSTTSQKKTDTRYH